MTFDRYVLVSLLVTASCGDSDPSSAEADAAVGTADSATGDAATTDDPQVPPQGHAAIVPWIEAAHYLAWACEPEPHPARPPGAHGTNRICSNAALSGSMSGPYPAGAASVKELYSNGVINGYAVALKLPTGTAGAAWYWYERIGGSVVADGAGVGLCTGCHDDAPRDFVFTRVE